MISQQITYKVRKKNADMLTPVGIFKRLKGEKKFLLESSFQHETKGKYSYIGANPREEIIGRGNTTEVIQLKDRTRKQYPGHALAYLQANMPKLELDIPVPFSGGAIGYVGYDAIRQFAPIGEELPDDLNIPDFHFMIYDTIIAYEHRTESAYLIAMNPEGKSTEALETVLNKVSEEIDQPQPQEAPDMYPVTFEAQIDKATFMKNVQKAKQHIHDGEATQIVLSQQMIAELDGDPFSFYRHLRSANPSPYMFYIDFTEYLIIGASPESLVQTTGRQVVTNPIAGTRPRGKNEAEDIRLEKELLQDKKELAEHDMLVDLSKQDFTAICDTNSITTPVYMDIMRYEHVMHIVSEVHGELQPDKTSLDALIACLPAGTVSGAPKVRAMQIINEIEEKRRGFYAGGIGYIAYNHDINLAISIRSLVVKNNHAYLQTGAGIVKDSDPEKEYEETLHKARSLTNLQKG